jgi:hypothetical protein
MQRQSGIALHAPGFCCRIAIAESGSHPSIREDKAFSARCPDAAKSAKTRLSSTFLNS